MSTASLSLWGYDTMSFEIKMLCIGVFIGCVFIESLRQDRLTLMVLSVVAAIWWLRQMGV